MQKRILTVLAGTILLATQAAAQQVTITGRVTRDENVPLSGVSVIVVGTAQGTQTNTQGNYTIQVDVGQTLRFRLIGYTPIDRVVGAERTIFVQLEKSAASLDAVVVTVPVVLTGIVAESAAGVATPPIVQALFTVAVTVNGVDVRAVMAPAVPPPTLT